MALHGKKILIGSIAFALVFFSGGFCAQASVPGDQGMTGMAMDGTAAHTLSMDDMIAQGMRVEAVSQAASHDWNICAFECGSTLPQATIVKKVKTDDLAPSDFSDAHISYALDARERSVFAGEGPGGGSSPDILLSIQKRE